MQKTHVTKTAIHNSSFFRSFRKASVFRFDARLISIAFIILSITAAVASADSAAHAKTPSGDKAPMPAVRLVQVQALDSERIRSFSGRVSARETVELSFEVGGRLLEFFPREGTRLAKGDIVAQLDSDPFKRAVRRADLNRKQALREMTRAHKLAASRVGSIVRAEDSETAVDLATVALADARDNLADTVLRAPFEALVSKRIGREFSNITAGQPIVSLHDMSEVRVEIDVPERIFFDVTRPEAITFRGVLPNGGESPLNLAEFEAQTEEIGQSFRVALVIPSEKAKGLIPGASMTVHATMPPKETGIPLPPSAILSGSDRSFEVMVFTPVSGDLGVVQRRRIELSAPEGTAFRGIGLEEGEEIVAIGAHLLSDGQTVRRYEGLVVEEE